MELIDETLDKTLREDWLRGTLGDSATLEMVAALRQESAEECCRHAVATMSRGVAAHSVWDALYLTA